MAWISIKGENHGLNSQPGDVWRDESKEDGCKPSVLSDLLGCPFCNEQDFDLIGLKIHLTKGHCDKFNELVIDTRPTLRDLL